MLNYYKLLNPEKTDVFWLINNCKFCQTKEMYKYLETLKE